MINVNLNDDKQETFEKAMKVFKKAVSNDGFMIELRDRRYFVKPSKKKHDEKRKIENLRKRKN